jgi:hypothetical protein
MHEMEERRLDLGLKPKSKGIIDGPWVKKLILSQCVMYLVGVLVQLELLLQLVHIAYISHFLSIQSL